MRAAPTTDVSQVPVSGASSPAEFAQCLEDVRLLAGPLSARELEKRSGKRLGRTKIGEVLAGSLPRRDFLLVYLEVCGVPQQSWADWLETWGRLARGDRARSGPTHAPTGNPHSGIGPAVVLDAVPDALESRDARVREALGEADARRAQIEQRAKSEADQLLNATNTRVRRAEDDRDSALAQLRERDRDLDAMRANYIDQLRVIEEERDKAVQRAISLADAMSELQDLSRKRIQDAESQRDGALAQVNALRAELEIAERKISDLSERQRYERIRSQEERDPRYAPAYLAEPNPEQVFGNDEMTAPPVIGE
jgi:hypothetical protein